jgi:acyl-CoA reductase-like NAD-dependent aldehyde dehydrogenase
MLIILAMRFLEYLNLYHVEVVEHACGMGTLQMGEYVSNVSHGVDTYSGREPIGVCAGIRPFNFPAMIPLWVSSFLPLGLAVELILFLL